MIGLNWRVHRRDLPIKKIPRNFSRNTTTTHQNNVIKNSSFFLDHFFCFWTQSFIFYSNCLYFGLFHSFPQKLWITLWILKDLTAFFVPTLRLSFKLYTFYTIYFLFIFSNLQCQYLWIWKKKYFFLIKEWSNTLAFLKIFKIKILLGSSSFFGKLSNISNNI